MRLLIWALILLTACAESDNAPRLSRAITVAGHLQSNALDEASGLARSQLHAGVLWAVNDDGPPRLYGLDSRGAHLGSVAVRNARNRDWEDLASFTLDEKAYLLIADIGDNEAQHDFVTVYVVEEPTAGDRSAQVAWRIDYAYPDGPRDAEAIAVDVSEQRIFVLSKRDIPAALYSLPLQPEPGDTIIAERLGGVSGLPQPRRDDVDKAFARQSWHWQPTGMDISADGRGVLILTNRGVYYYARRADEALVDALRRPLLGLSLGRVANAESIAFGNDNAVAYVTTEGHNAPILNVNLEGATRP